MYGYMPALTLFHPLTNDNKKAAAKSLFVTAFLCLSLFWIAFGSF
jgi:hypothetical protein